MAFLPSLCGVCVCQGFTAKVKAVGLHGSCFCMLEILPNVIFGSLQSNRFPSSLTLFKDAKPSSSSSEQKPACGEGGRRNLEFVCSHSISESTSTPLNGL